MTGYTIVDLETTGFSPRHHDRVVEVGVVFVSDQGQVEGEWSTLINPMRDIGATHVHGITARDVVDAPTFAQIAPALLRAFTGRTVTAHNARFDLLFLQHEFARAGFAPSELPLPGLCTMQWATSHIRAASRKLVDCCAAADIPFSRHHSALDDAKACALLLAHLIRVAGAPLPWTRELEHSRAYPWPPYEREEAPLVGRANTTERRPSGWLDRIVAGMPHWDDLRVESYLEVLEDALLDRYLSAHEEKALVELAIGLGLDRDRLETIHRDYLTSMAAVALADGVVTTTEMEDLQMVADLLGLTHADVQVALANGSTAAPAQTFALNPGDQICLTGQMVRERDAWETDAVAAGLVVGGLTKRTRLLVAADPDSRSGKAAKAREYGTPIVTEAAFSDLLAQLQTSRGV